MLIIKAKVRNMQGKGASRRLRTTNRLPAIIYGDNRVPVAVELDHDKMWNLQSRVEFYSGALIIVINGKEEKVKVKDIQRHVFKPKLVHIDFIRA